jgi:2,3-dihydroxyphenylpropionate 1,2-dioxygenase
VRQRNVVNEGILFSDGHSRLRPLSPTWDEGFIRAMAGGDLCFLDQMYEEAITAEAGTGAHELRCWIAALSAIGGYTAGESFYAPVEPWITGMGLMTATPFGAARQLTD